MIGNDLVDLQQAALDSNWQRKGYLEKIFSTAEQLLIRQADSPSTMVWLLWSMKEASYKIVNRKDGIRRYNPLSFNCSQLITDQFAASGTVRYADDVFFLQSTVSSQMIHSIASAQNNFDHIQSHFMENTPGYAAIFNQLSASHELIKNKTGIPEMIHTPARTSYAASVSHHGRYLAIIYSDVLLSIS